MIKQKRFVIKKAFCDKKAVCESVINRCPKPWSTGSFICKNRFIPFDSVSLATLRFELLWRQKRLTLQNVLQNIEYRFAYLARNFETWAFLAEQETQFEYRVSRSLFCKKFCKAILFWFIDWLIHIHPPLTTKRRRRFYFGRMVLTRFEVELMPRKFKPQGC